MEENSTRLVLQPVLKKEYIIMKSKELAEELLKYPDFDVKVSVCTFMATYDKPYDEHEIRDISDIDYVEKIDGIIVLES